MPWPPASPAAVHRKMIGHLRGLKWMCLIFFLLLQLFEACCYLKITAGTLFFSATCKPTCIAKIQCNSSDRFVTARNQEDSYIFRHTPHLLCKCTIPGQVMNLPARLCYFKICFYSTDSYGQVFHTALYWAAPFRGSAVGKSICCPLCQDKEPPQTLATPLCKRSL